MDTASESVTPERPAQRLFEHYSEVGGGYGGYNKDDELFGYRQSI
ncbi:MAG TPA: hypothetical protein VIJ18_16460 [Microbacteriaceae bacterium]